jgi:cytidylate kinase
MIVAIDGPAGSGKSTTARALARALAFRHLDSGAFYRALTLAALRRGIPVERWDSLEREQLEALGVTAEPADLGFRVLIAGDDVSDEIRAADVNAHVSAMARVPAVREWLLDQLRAAAHGSDLVADGRDIGTVVFPDAALKIFLVADPRVRAQRRLAQMGLPTDPGAVRAEVQRIEARDRTDSERAAAPLRQASDAVLLDTSGLTFEEQVGRVVELARERMRSG